MAVSGETIKTINSLHYEDNNEEQRMEETLHASLKEANLIKQKVKNPELKEKFQEEYNELEKVILESVNNDLQISHSERMNIMLELSDVITLAEEHDISTDFRKRDSFWGVFSRITESDVKGVENEAKKLLKKDISQYTKSEQLGALEYLNNNFNDYVEGNFALTDEENISDLSDIEDVKAFQERLIDMINSTNDGSTLFIKKYSDDKGFYLDNINSFKKNILQNGTENLDQVSLESFVNITKKEADKLGIGFEEYIIKTYDKKTASQILDKALKLGVYESELSWAGEIVYDAISDFNNNLDVDAFSYIPDFLLPDELAQIINQWETSDSNKGKYLALFKISQFFHSFSDNALFSEIGVSDSFLTKAHNKSTENILEKINNEEEEDFLIGYTNETGYTLSNTEEFENKIQTLGANKVNNTELISYFGNLDNYDIDQLVGKLGIDNIMYISVFIMENNTNFDDGFLRLRRILGDKINLDKIQNIATDFLESEFLQTPQGGQLLAKNFSKIKNDNLKQNLVNRVSTNKNICVKCEGGNFEDKYVLEILNISKKRELEDIYEGKRNEFNQKIINEIKKSNPNGEIPTEISEELTLLGNEMFNDSLDNIKDKGCAFDLISYAQNHKNFEKIKTILSQYNIDMVALGGLQKSLTENISQTNYEIQEKKLEIRELEFQKLKNEGKLTKDEIINISNSQIKQKYEIAEAKRINQVTHAASIDEYKIISQMSNEGYSQQDIMLYLGESNDDFKNIIKEYKQDIKSIQNIEEIISIDSQSELRINTQEDKNTYTYAGLTYEIPDVAVNNNFSIINYQTGEKIEISKDEKETIQDNPEALKNLIDTKQKLEMLGLDFVWDNRVEFIQIMKNTPGFNDTGKIDTGDKDYLNISEFNHLLKFVLFKTTGNFDSDYYTNMSKIREINGENELNEKRNFVSGLSNIGQNFVELGFLTQSGTLNFHWANTKNYSEIKGYNSQQVA